MFTGQSDSNGNRQSPRDPAPDVSVIITADGSLDLLATTVSALTKNARGKSIFETILLLPSEDSVLFTYASQVSNISTVGANLIKIRACRNLVINMARGRRLLFINAGIICAPETIDMLISGFQQFKMAGIIGARRIAIDGKLLEAGGSFDSERNPLKILKFPDTTANSPSVLFTRECGFVFGEVVMVDSGLFNQIGGYNLEYADTSYADADLCVRIRKVGRQVIYESRATVTDCRQDKSIGPVALREDCARFLDQHAEWLFGPGTPAHDPLHRENDSHRLRILFLDDKIPHIDFGAGLPRANSIVNSMVALGYRVTVYPFTGTLEDDINARYRDLSPTIEILEPHGRDGLIEIIKSRIGCYDLIWVSRPHNIYDMVNSFFEAGIPLRKFVTKVVFDLEASFAYRRAIQSTLKAGVMTSEHLINEMKIETEFIPMADTFVVVSECEAELFRAVHGDGIQIQTLGHVLPVRQSDKLYTFSERRGVVFLGSLANEAEPNADSMDWFLEHIWPHVLRRDPDVPLNLIGEICGSLRERYENYGATVLGRLESVSTILGKFRVGVAPTRFAAGIPHKIHELVSYGTPVVATPLLATQLNWVDGEGILIAPWQDPQYFAINLLQMLHDEKLWTQVSTRGLLRVGVDCDEESFRKRLRDICE